MLTREPPIYVVCPGRVYRTDELRRDAHSRSSTRSRAWWSTRASRWRTCKGTLDHFARGDVRRDPDPAAAVTTSRSPSRRPRSTCSASSATAPRSATRPPLPDLQSEGWIEWGGCGVVNPRVLQRLRHRPDVYSGFAFGMGVDRTLMFRNDVEDMRDMIEGDVRFSRSRSGWRV